MEIVGRTTFCFALVLILLVGLIQCRGGRGGGRASGGGSWGSGSGSRGSWGGGGSRGSWGSGSRNRGSTGRSWSWWKSKGSTLSGRPKTSLYSKSLYSGHRKTVNSDGFGTGKCEVIINDPIK